MTLLIVLALLIALDLGAWRWSHDSRDGRTGRPRTASASPGAKAAGVARLLDRFQRSGPRGCTHRCRYSYTQREVVTDSEDGPPI
jgi:hypothetical protein